RNLKGWQGHNPEEVWLMVLVFESNRPGDAVLEKTAPGLQSGKPKTQIPFRFLMVVAAPLEKSDWKFAGRSATSRRTITASVADTGYQKLMQNWIYKVPGLGE